MNIDSGSGEINGVEACQLRWIIEQATSVTWCPGSDEWSAIEGLTTERFPYEGRELTSIERSVACTALRILIYRIRNGDIESTAQKLYDRLNTNPTNPLDSLLQDFKS